MTNHKRTGVSHGLCPENVKSLLGASRTPPQASAEERESAQSSCTALLCMWLLLFTRAHLPLLLSVTECAQRSTSARGSWNLCSWHRIVYERERDLCACRCVFARATFDTNITPYRCLKLCVHTKKDTQKYTEAFCPSDFIKLVIRLILFWPSRSL